MLGLKLATDPNWVNIAQKNIEEILSDHAYCEQKAASNAISIVLGWPQYDDLVRSMLSIAKEELTHFEMVFDKIKSRGYQLGFERKDEYVNELYKFMRKGHKRHFVLIDRLLFAAMIEARSCERFKLLSTEINDEDLKDFYRDLMVSEASHYTTFLNFARQYGQAFEDVNQRWQQWLDYEAEVIQKYGTKESIHG